MTVQMIFLLITAFTLINLSSSLTHSSESKNSKDNSLKEEVEKPLMIVPQHQLLKILSENEKANEDPHHQLKDTAATEKTSRFLPGHSVGPGFKISEESGAVTSSSLKEVVGNIENEGETSALYGNISSGPNISKRGRGGSDFAIQTVPPTETANETFVDRSNWTREARSQIDLPRETDRDSISQMGTKKEEINCKVPKVEEMIRVQSLSATSTACPCLLHHDPVYGGDLLKCSSLELDHVSPDWLNPRTTTLLLDSNKLTRLGNGTFASAPNLRFLDLSRNNLITMEIETFRGVSCLEEINLRENKLNLGYSFWPCVFEYTPNLRQLNLGFNGNERKSSTYPSRMFKGLKNLHILILDTFANDLDFGDIFYGLNKLNSLTLTGGVRNIRNESFLSFDTIPLDTLKLQALDWLEYTEEAAYQPLKKLQSFYIYGTNQNIEATLRSLYPFAQRSMKNLIFHNIGKNSNNPDGIIYKDGIIDHYKAQFLSTICVENFAFTDSWVTVIEAWTLTSKTWARCLKSVDLSNLAISGDRVSLLQALRMKYLAVIIMRGSRHRKWRGCSESSNCHAEACANSVQRDWTRRRRETITRGPKGTDSHTAGYSLNNRDERSMNDNESYDTEKRLFLPHKYVLSKHVQDDYMIKNLNSSSDINKDHSPSSKNGRGVGVTAGFITVKITDSVRILDIERSVGLQGSLDFNVRIKGAKNLRAVYDGNNRVDKFTGIILGLSKLEIYDMSYNDASILSPAFFDHFPSLRYLNMKHTNLISSFMIEHSARLFHNLTSLHCLNLADNSLSSLSSRVFSTNPQMIRLDLSYNRFNSIPFNIGFLPELSFLDMSFNSISYLSKHEMDSLDARMENSGNFSLHLEGNLLSCGCFNLRFLDWLQSTHVVLDSSRNYTCITESGDVSNTLSRRDILALWRTCNGQFHFFVSLILASLMALMFISFTLYIRLKTTLVSYFLQIFLPQFKLYTPENYRYGVYIAYSDADSLFACVTLRNYLENELGLTTFVKDRNILPGSDMAESIVDAVNSSWRVIVLVTPAFLREDDWAYFTMKTATYAVNPRNPRLLVALVEDGVKHAMPFCLLRVLNEANLVTMSEPGFLENEQKEKLKRAVLDVRR